MIFTRTEVKSIVAEGLESMLEVEDKALEADPDITFKQMQELIHRRLKEWVEDPLA